MLSTAIMAVLGFLFWLISAHLFTPDDIGVATTLISAMNLISYIGLLGFNSTFVRVLPNSKQRSEEINTGLLLAAGAAIAIAAVYVLLIPIIAPSLGIVRDNWLYAAGFIFMVALACVNLLTDSMFIAFRAAKFNLLIDGVIMSGIKLLLPLLFVSLGAYGLFAASGSAAVIALVLSVFFLITRFGYRPRLSINTRIVRQVMRYSFSNYIANLLNIAPTLILPMIIINQLGTASAGYYYLASMIATLLYTAAYAVSQSLFAEGSYADKGLGVLLRRSTTVMAIIMIPGALAIYFGAPLLLRIYGQDYAEQAAPLLQILALSAPMVAIYTIANVIQRIAKQNYGLVIVNLVFVVSVTVLTGYWAHNGLVWVGYAWLAGQTCAAMTGIVLIWAARKRQTRTALNQPIISV